MKERPWGFAPYAPKLRPDRAVSPYICRVAPDRSSICFEWFDPVNAGECFAAWRLQGDGEFSTRPVEPGTVTIGGLEENRNYEICVFRADGSARSDVRLVFTCECIGTVVNYSHPEDPAFDFSGRYLGSPFIIRLPSGRLIISHDFHGIGPQQALSVLFYSDDDGESWHFLTELYPMFWPKLFVNGGVLYAMGPAGQYGDYIISCSHDDGKTWREPVVLLRGDHGSEEGMHQAPTPVTFHNGRIYTGIEFGNWTKPGKEKFAATVLSAPCGSDLLDPASWDFTPPVPFDPANANFPDADFVTAIEGNAIPGPDGVIYNLLRIDPVGCDRSKVNNTCIMTKLVSFDEPLRFVRMIDAPVGIRHKFFIQHDGETNLYFMVHNEETVKNIERRCIFSLSASEDLVHWRRLTTLLDCTDIPRNGVSYPSFIIDGDDILYVSRTAYGQLKNEHDNNYVTFHRLRNFRDLVT